MTAEYWIWRVSTPCLFPLSPPPVPTCERAQCESSSFLHLRSSEGHLSSWVTATNGCGSASCPWVVEALPGQRINITLFDFSISARNASNSLSSKLRPGYPLYCHEYAVIKETEVPRSTTICGGDYRERVAYVSSSNKVEVTMISRKLGATVEYFLLQYKGKCNMLSAIINLMFFYSAM